MAASSSMSAQLEDIFKRLNYLEKREESTSDEMLKLRRENLDLTRANKVLDKKVRELSISLDAMSVARTNEDLIKRLDKVEAEVQVIEQKVDVLECNTCPGLSDKVEGLGTEVKALKQNNDFKDSTAFSASVKPTQPLVKGTGVKLDKCDFVNTPGSYFDEGCGVYQSPLDGLYDVRVMMSQKGKGRLRVKVKIEGFSPIVIGKTEQDGDMCHCSHVVWLEKGHKVSVEVVRLDGQAEVGWCILSGFLVCPL